MLSLITIGAPIVTGLIRDESAAALVGGITGVLLTLGDTEGSLWDRLGTTAEIALGIAVGGLLGWWLASMQPMFWIVFFAGIFAAGLLNQVGKGPHFAVRFGAIAFAVIAGLPALPPEAAWYFAGAAALSLVVKFIDQTINGPLPDGAPWPGSIAADWSHWFRFALAYAIAASAGLWIGVQSGSVRAVWTAVHRAGDHAAGFAHHLGAYLPGQRRSGARRGDGDPARAFAGMARDRDPAAWMVLALYTPDEIKAQKKAKVDPAWAIVWRCMGGKIFGCVQGNSPICGTANQEMVPTKAMREFCAGQPNAEVIPLSVIGHDHPMIYDWQCGGTKPAIARQIFTVDARGFPVELWKEIAPPK